MSIHGAIFKVAPQKSNNRSLQYLKRKMKTFYAIFSQIVLKKNKCAQLLPLFLKTNLFERWSDNKEKREVFTHWLILQMPQQLELGQVEARSQGVHLGLIRGGRNPRTWVITCFLPSTLAGSWTGSTDRTQTQALQYVMWVSQGWLNLLSHNNCPFELI